MIIKFDGYWQDGIFIKLPADIAIEDCNIPKRYVPDIDAEYPNKWEGATAEKIFNEIKSYGGTDLRYAPFKVFTSYRVKGTVNYLDNYQPVGFNFVWGDNNLSIPAGTRFMRLSNDIHISDWHAYFKIVPDMGIISASYAVYDSGYKQLKINFKKPEEPGHAPYVYKGLFYDYFNVKPNFDDDINEEAGGDGNGDNTTDTVTLPSLPTLSATSSGMIQMYAPSSLTLKDFSKYLWSQHIFDNFGKLFQNPIEAILSLSIIPVEFPLSSSSNIMLGNLDSKISSPTVPAQYMELDMGTYTFDEYWGNFLDYAPHTSISIFLPFIGVRELNTNDVMGGTINVKYRLDLLTGMCTSYITVKRGDFDALLYQYTGNCSISIPLTANNLTAQITAMAGLALPAVTSAVIGNPAPLLTAGAGAITNPAQAHIDKTSGTQFNSGYLGIWEPYIIIERPIQAYPKGMDKYQGFTTRITASLGDLSGYTEVEDIHLDNIPATDTELAEIDRLLKEGIIL